MLRQVWKKNSELGKVRQQISVLMTHLQSAEFESGQAPRASMPETRGKNTSESFRFI